MVEKLGIFMRVYNTRPYLEQCISSVLSQTCSDFVFYIIDNGCTDGSSELLDRYAAEDRRIRLTRYEQNNPYMDPLFYMIQQSGHPYISILDADDWWEPDYLERLLSLMSAYDLDIAITGTIHYYEASHTSRVDRSLSQPAIFSQQQFASQYPIYWVYPSTYWGNIMKNSLCRQVDISVVNAEIPGYGWDTGFMLHYLENCARIGIDDSALYHYRIRGGSVSSVYVSSRFDANAGYTKLIREFLEKNNAFDDKKRDWLYRVHLASILATAGAMKTAALPPVNKVWECARIITHPLTVEALAHPSRENTDLRTLVGDILRMTAAEGRYERFEDIERILTAVSPSCGSAVTEDAFPLFLKEPALLDALLRDGRNELAKGLLSLVEENRYVRQYDLAALLGALAGEESPLHGIGDIGFIRKYRDIYWRVWTGQLEAALDQMTGLLLENSIQAGKEAFLSLYLSIAAAQNEVPAFLFGNMQLAWLYLQQKRYHECREALAGLEAMGLTDHQELSAIREALERAEPIDEVDGDFTAPLA